MVLVSNAIIIYLSKTRWCWSVGDRECTLLLTKTVWKLAIEYGTYSRIQLHVSQSTNQCCWLLFSSFLLSRPFGQRMWAWSTERPITINSLCCALGSRVTVNRDNLRTIILIFVLRIRSLLANPGGHAKISLNSITFQNDSCLRSLYHYDSQPELHWQWTDWTNTALEASGIESLMFAFELAKSAESG